MVTYSVSNEEENVFEDRHGALREQTHDLGGEVLRGLAGL